MRRLLNTLFVTTETAYLTLDGENIVVKEGGKELGRFSFMNLSDIISFSYAGASSALMGACAERKIGLSFCTPGGTLSGTGQRRWRRQKRAAAAHAVPPGR